MNKLTLAEEVSELVRFPPLDFDCCDDFDAVAEDIEYDMWEQCRRWKGMTDRHANFLAALATSIVRKWWEGYHFFGDAAPHFWGRLNRSLPQGYCASASEVDDYQKLGI